MTDTAQEARISSVAQAYQSQAWIGRLYPPGSGMEPAVLFVAAPVVNDACQAAIRDLRTLDEEAVIVTLCTHNSEQELLALEAGADDCITVPEGFIDALRRLDIIMARIRRQATRRHVPHQVLANPHTREVSVGGGSVSTSPMEFRLLFELQKQRGKVVPYGQLERLLWGTEDAAARQALKQLTRRLRRRLGSGKDSIVVVRGVGYMLT